MQFMMKSEELLCDIIFLDHKLGFITSRIGIIDVSQLRNFE